MQKRLILVISSLFLIFSASAYAHNGPFAHPQASNEVAHLFMHMLMLLPVAAGAFFLGRWWFRRNLRASRIHSADKR